MATYPQEKQCCWSRLEQMQIPAFSGKAPAGDSRGDSTSHPMILENLSNYPYSCTVEGDPCPAGIFLFPWQYPLSQGQTTLSSPISHTEQSWSAAPTSENREPRMVETVP